MKSVSSSYVVLLLFTLAVALRPALAQGQTYPHPISLQGLLLDAEGRTLSGNYAMTFRIYDASEGGTVLWQENHASVLVNDGIYGVALGLNPNLPPDLFTGLPRYLEVTVAGEVQDPRIELRAVPVSYAAKTLTDGALQAGSNVTLSRQPNGTLRIDATGGTGGGGLSSVATDASLGGDGTAGNPLTLADGAVAEAKLEDNAVTGAKIADSALVAGQNMTITRQNDGSLALASSGGGTSFSLPYSGIANSAAPALRIENSGTGDGLHIKSNSVSGIQVENTAGNGSAFFARQTTWGVILDNPTFDGVSVSAPGQFGISVDSPAISGLKVSQSQSDGVTIDGAGRYGLNIINAQQGIDIGFALNSGIVVQNTGSNGVQVNQASVDGLQIQSAGRDGLRVEQATNDGVLIAAAGRFGLNVISAVRGVDINTTSSDAMLVRNAGRHGLLIQDATSKGLQIDQAGNNGIQIGQTGLNAIQIDQAGVDGLHILAAGRDGLRVSGASGLAGNFNGDVDISGTLSKAGGSFKIDHPLDPAGKYLSHSFVESPDMMNVYNGNIVLDATGAAWVTLPDYFEALNRDFRYQLTALGAPGPNLYVADKISANRFRIAGGTPGMEVSWQVTGIRQDPWAKEHRITVEEDKKPEDQGYYLHPRLHNQPETLNVIRPDTPNNF